ncbi:S41 family peptidase [Fluviicola sp.]|uniref:S41 family peptidase n=1 Tax=Fluviicola sp. TaxID=1917219 RepID=UPI00260DE7A4|nr:S41 family peptidase [Fluviicola sp.]
MKFFVLNFVLLFLFNTSLAQNNPSHFKSDIDFGGGTVISTFLDVHTAKNQFTITSPKNADVRMMGGFKARLGRLAGKLPKKGTIIRIKGTPKSDSLFGEASIPVFGKLSFKGTTDPLKGTLSGVFLKADGTSVGTVQGVSSAEDKFNYSTLYPQLLKTIRDNIYSKNVLQTKEWKKFEKEFESLGKRAHDDIELFFGFNVLTPKLPFTHLTLLIGEDQAEEEAISPDDEKQVSTNKSVIFEEKNDSTAYLQIKNFSSSAEELAAVLPGIVANKAYKNLIIDLRNNGGGGIDAAFALAKHIVTEDLEVGYFPTNKLPYIGYQSELFRTLNELQPKSTEEFGNELKRTPGVKLIFRKPVNPVFTGKLYVLTNGGTGSTCEPIVYALKNNKKATIIGERTAGAMLAASPFFVERKYMLLIPIADFYTNDGVRLDKVGVSPDIEVKSEDADEKALEIINNEVSVK